MKRTVFFVSDGTGITAENFGYALTTQFQGIEFESQTMPYIDTIEKARNAVATIEQHAEAKLEPPIIFSTLVNEEIRQPFRDSSATFLDFFAAFIHPLENALGTKSGHTVGLTHGIEDQKSYETRIDAVNFALATDDGIGSQFYDKADVILLGVSRSGKTPTSLYLALQYGIRASNYPLTAEDFEQHRIPEILKIQRKKLFGLTIDAERLSAIRTERRPDSQYASLQQCRLELGEAEHMFHQLTIPYLNSTAYSIEEIATKLLAKCGLSRRIYG